jgi:drug/metabolite transporter (DMT)-like permease
MHAPAIQALPARRDDISRGILYACVAVFVFSAMNTAVKWLAASYPVLEIVFFRSSFALLPCAVLIWRAGGPATLKTAVPWSHAFRASIWFGSVCCTFMSYHLLPMADAVAISFSAPLFLTALSVPILGEKVGRHRWGAVIAGFFGVLIMVRPGSGVLQWGAVYGLGNAVFYALGALSVRQMTTTERGSTIVFYTMLLAAVLSAFVLPFIWVTPRPIDLLALALLGIAGGCGQLIVVQALRFAPAAAVAPFNYTAMVWALGFGYALWGDLPGSAVLAGAAVVIASGLYILHRETRKKAARAAPAGAT